MGIELAHQTKAKLPCLTLFKSVFVTENNTLPAFEPVCDANSSEVKKKLLNLKSFKSPRVDNLHPRILKELSGGASVTLSILYTESFKQQKLSQDWKDAMITPLYKKDRKCLASNYTPISLPSITRTRMESIIKDDLISCACNKNIRKNIFACLFSVHNTISFSRHEQRHEQVCLMRLRFERYFSHHRAM